MLRFWELLGVLGKINLSAASGGDLSFLHKQLLSLDIDGLKLMWLIEGNTHTAVGPVT